MGAATTEGPGQLPGGWGRLSTRPQAGYGVSLAKLWGQEPAGGLILMGTALPRGLEWGGDGAGGAQPLQAPYSRGRMEPCIWGAPKALGGNRVGGGFPVLLEEAHIPLFLRGEEPPALPEHPGTEPVGLPRMDPADPMRPIGHHMMPAPSLPRGGPRLGLKTGSRSRRAGATGARMGVLGWLVASALCAAVRGRDQGLSRPLPHFGSIYHVRGVINLPYAEIEEPFEAWYNLTGNKSRIQYYGGQVITYQLAGVKPYGMQYKITPETTEKEVNARKCFQLPGSKEDVVRIQSVFPSLEGFKFLREEYYQGRYCAVWQNVTLWAQKKNVYTLWVTNSSCGVAPVHYEMRGYNSLLGSHYDKYEISYTDFDNSFPSSVFDIPVNETKKCGLLPGSTAEHRVLANPMEDLVGRHQPRAHEVFHHYRRRFGRRYGSARELEHRQHVFVHNMRFVHSKNRAALSYTLALNHLADRTPQELAALRGRRQSGAPNHGLPFPAERYAGLILPESLDWRMYGAVTPVKDQAVCGSCWSFATTGAMEGALFLKTGVLTPLSQQVLIDCSWGFGNQACDGGEEWRAYEWIKKHGGIASTESYGPYLGQNGYCHCNQSELVAPLAGYVNVEPGSATALKAALVKHGPVAVNIDASHKSFAFYANGVYEEPRCGNETSELDHAVLAVGYGVLHGKSYWLIKNSWSTYWGNDGYILMAMKDNNCGVATAASFPVLA
uniref:Counting factor associated protein D n=1 Tax=Anas platyrhynchos platyrhynchos TaxID=8840 RepID=A0A493T062_ANAPP